MSVEIRRKIQKSREFLGERVSVNRKTVRELVDDDRDQHTRLLNVAVDLRQSEWLFREVINALPAAIYITDAEGCLTHFNQAAVELSGRVPELGTDHWCVTWKLYHADGRPMPHDECPMAVALKEGCAVRGAEAIGERPDGTRFWFIPYPTPLFDDQGKVIGGINMLVDITYRKMAEARSQSEADALAKLNELSSRLWSMRNLREGLEEMLSATIEMLGADFGNIQLLDESRGVLTIEAQHGFKQDFLDFFREVRADDDSTCARALRSGERIIVDDVEMDAPFVSMLHIINAAGVRAVQSTPLIGRNGTPLGMISTHFRAVHRPSEQELRRLDLYARQASDFIERCRADDALRQSEERFRMLADNMGQLAWICDQLGNVTWYNQRWLDYTGLTFADMKGWDWSKVQHPDHLDRVLARLKHSSETGEPWEDVFPLRGKDGSYRWFLSSALPIRTEYGEIVCWFGTNTDIEELKQAREAAETANRIKDEFLATVSHELRTPLNAIMGWTHLLTRGKLDEETVARGLNTIARNASAQNQLISDLLDVSRIISRQLRFESGVVDLIPVLEAATESVRPAADAKRIGLRLDLDQGAGLVSGDAMRLQQVVWNLLSNAIKFTPPGGQVTVRLKRENSSVVLSVTDTGEGISAEFLPYIFDRFRQGESTNEHRQGGLGLGLTIVRHLVEAHGGTIRAASKGVGHGATFTVTLPLLAVDSKSINADRAFFSSAPAASVSSRILDGLRVLVIDDEEDARELLTIALTQSGAEVRTAGTVKAALEILNQWNPNVLVSDIGMPGENGYDLIRTVRAQEREKGGTIPALALTGYASAEDAARARAAGYQTHMAKPVAPSDLVAAVASLATEASVLVGRVLSRQEER